MKFTAIATLLFTVAAMANPVPAPEADSGALLANGELDARASCGAGCSCLKGNCQCAVCNQMTCVYVPNGRKC
ncbi:hypothetical protein V8F06_012395 [Rhypophila decipiens]